MIQLCCLRDFIKLRIIIVAFIMKSRCKDHPFVNTSFICTERECQNNRIICSQCCFTNHIGHETQSLRLTLADIIADQEPNPRYIGYIASIDMLHLRFRALLQQAKTAKKDLEIQSQRFFRNIRQQIEDYRQICNQILQGETQLDSNRLAKKLKMYPFFCKDQKLGKSNYTLLIEDIIGYLEQKLQQLQQIIKTKADVNRLLCVFKRYGQNNTNEYHFSEKYQSPGVILSSDQLTVTQDSSYSTNSALILPFIEGKCRIRGRRSIRFKINKALSWLAVGVAYAEPIHKVSFKMSTSSTGHGAYLASYHGYTFHSDDSQQNSTMNGFTYQSGDIIIVTVNFSEEHIHFQKQKQNRESLQLSFKRQIGQQLHFYVYFRDPQESVTILN